MCDSECPYNLILGRTSMAQLSTWQDYATNKLYIQQISIPLTVRNNIRILPRKTGTLTLTLRLNKTSFTPRHSIIGKGIAYVKPHRPIEIEFQNNHCCVEVHNTSATTVEFLHGKEIAYFDARSKGLVQTAFSSNYAGRCLHGLLVFSFLRVRSLRLFLGNVCERFCASRSLLGSYVHKSQLN